jgi:soluble lytic murein transglycosylase-like protein
MNPIIKAGAALTGAAILASGKAPFLGDPLRYGCIPIEGGWAQLDPGQAPGIAGFKAAMLKRKALAAVDFAGISKDKILELAADVSKEYDIPPGLMAGIIEQESSFRIAAFSNVSNSTACGLCQTVYTSVRGVASRGYSRGGQLYYTFEPTSNLKAGCAILRAHFESAGRDWFKGLSGYGGGYVDGYAASIFNRAKKYGFDVDSLSA